jgi:hypothetical protein
MTDFKISSNKYMSGLAEIKSLLSQDTDPKKPKKLTKKDGTLTAQGLKYNRKLLLQGKTKINLDKSRVFIPPTATKGGSFRTAVFDARDGKVKRSLLKDNILYQGVLVPKQETKLRDIIAFSPKKFKGTYRIVINDPDEGILLDKVYNINENFWKENITDFMTGDSDEPYLWNKYPEAKTIITKETFLPQKYYQQKYKRGITNCLLTPILKDFEDKMEQAKSKTSKGNYQAMINKIVGKKAKDKRTQDKIGYLAKHHSEGVSEEDIVDICDDLKIGIQLVKPFSSEKYFEYESVGSRKKYTFLNAGMNHVEYKSRFNPEMIVKMTDSEKIKQEDFNELIKKLDNENTFYTYKKNNQGIFSVMTIDKFYTIQSDYYDTFIQFEFETGLKWTTIDGLAEPEVQRFINDGTHYNGTIDFMDTEFLRHIGKKDKPPEGIEHIDMIKAYTQFYNSKYYIGFMGKITDFRECKTMESNGLYKIINLKIHNEKLKKLNDKLTWFVDGNIYTKAELKAIESIGASFDITYGLFGNFLDFKFNEDMMKEEIIGDMKLPYYSKWTGMSGSLRTTNDSFYMKGHNEFLQTINQSEELNILVNGYDDEARITFRKKAMNNKKHISAQIMAYCRLNILEQIMKMDLDKIVRLCVDGIYYYKHNYENRETIINKKHNVFALKDKHTYRNTQGETYLSNLIFDTEDYDKIISKQ